MNELNTNAEWALAATQLQQAGEDYVLVTVLGSRGSTPRDTGTKMVVCAAQSYGTIGGGHLELRAVEIALQMIQLEEDHQRVEYFPLGPSLGQCCGGSTSGGVGVIDFGNNLTYIDVRILERGGGGGRR